jgi:transposase InsO family protein
VAWSIAASRWTCRPSVRARAASCGRPRPPAVDAAGWTGTVTVGQPRVYRTSYRTREEAELDLVRWIDGWYNPRRIQRELGWLTPDEYEEA